MVVQVGTINKALIVKVDTDDEYEFARDMQVISPFLFTMCTYTNT